MSDTHGPVPQGDYVPARRHGNVIFTSGMTPRRDGVMLFHGPISRDAAPEDWREAVRLAAANALTAAQTMLEGGETIATILNLTVYIAAEPGFQAHAKLADHASSFLREQLGQAGIGARAAIGVATLPGNAPVEVQITAGI